MLFVYIPKGRDQNPVEKRFMNSSRKRFSVKSPPEKFRGNLLWRRILLVQVGLPEDCQDFLGRHHDPEPCFDVLEQFKVTSNGLALSYAAPQLLSILNVQFLLVTLGNFSASVAYYLRRMPDHSFPEILISPNPEKSGNAVHD